MARKFFIFSCVLAMFAGLLCVSQAAPTPPLAPQLPIALPRAPGFFDYMEIDDQYRRLLVAHTDSRTLDIIDLKSETLARQVEVGEGHGIAVDVKDGRYFVGTSRPQFIVDVQRKYMVKQNQVPMAGPIDAVALDTKSDKLYADRSDNGQIVVMDVRTRQIDANIEVGGSLEFIVYDPVSDRIYQNVTSTGRVAVIDPNTNSIVASWAAAPAGQLRGLAVDGATHRLFSAGANGKLAVIDTTTGELLGAVDIAPGVDQVAFDASTKRLYCASGTGELSVVSETDAGAESLGDITVPRHAHTVAVDPTTHNVWISYGAPDNDYVMKLVPVTPSPSPSPST
jgi:DNA-binding beta-propeller fold protein YncE